MPSSLVMNSILGSAPVLDFDGTIAPLPVTWATLRSELGVKRIQDLWLQDRPGAWAAVRAAEEEAARQADLNPRVGRALEEVSALAVLTNNSEASVAAFLARFPHLERRVTIVVGREQLGGPKDEFAVFERGFRSCVTATATARGDEPIIYVGDADYELSYARRLGAQAWNVEVL
jgi:phosphoglycolate phosphatase-like HAD superfamily hydrolase